MTSSLLFQPEVGFGFIRHAERASSRAIDDQHAARDSFSPYPGGGVVGFEREWAQTFASTMARAHAARERVEFGLPSRAAKSTMLRAHSARTLAVGSIEVRPNGLRRVSGVRTTRRERQLASAKSARAARAPQLDT